MDLAPAWPKNRKRPIQVVRPPTTPPFPVATIGVQARYPTAHPGPGFDVPSGVVLPPGGEDRD